MIRCSVPLIDIILPPKMKKRGRPKGLGKTVVDQKNKAPKRKGVFKILYFYQEVV